VLQSAGLEELQEELQIPNHRVPLSAKGVAQALHAGQLVQQLLQDADTWQPTKNLHSSPVQPQETGGNTARVFLYTSPFLRCIQTAQHAVRGLDDNRVGANTPCTPHSVHLIQCYDIPLLPADSPPSHITALCLGPPVHWQDFAMQQCEWTT